MDVYLLYGPPGSGKGTVSEKIPRDHVLGIGSLLRSKGMCLDGNFAPDEIVNKLIENEICNRKQYVVLDGYPRTMTQADYLIQMKNINLVRVYSLSCPDEMLINRLGHRLTCSCGATYHPMLKPPKIEKKCDFCGSLLFRRKDDHPAVVRKRLEQFHKTTSPILNKFQSKVKTIDVSCGFREKIIEIAAEILTEQSQQSNNNKIKSMNVRTIE